MSEVERMAELLRRSFEDDAWAGQPLRAVLEGVTAQQAAERPIAGAHSIWEIAVHAGAWADVVRRRLGGERVLEPDEGDWAEVAAADDAGWRSVLSQLEEREQALLRAIREIDAARLDMPAVDGMSSVYNQVHGIIQHNLYHAAQIAVLKRAVGDAA